MKKVIKDNKIIITIAIIIAVILATLILLPYIIETVVINIIRDIVITISITFSFSLNIYFSEKDNLNQIYVAQLDNDIFKEINEIYKRLDESFINKDFSMSIKNDLFDDLFKFLDYNSKTVTFKFSNNKLNDSLALLIKDSKLFVEGYFKYMHDYNDTLKVSMSKLLRNNNKPREVFSKHEHEEEILNNLFKDMINKYSDFVVLYKKIYSNHK